MNESTLKPCPLCGGQSEIRELVLWVYSEKLYEADVYIKCMLCGAHCKSFRNDKEAAIKMWNTRPAQGEAKE